MKIIAIITASLLPILGLTSCETMNGLGKDIQKAGEGLENAAN